MSHEISSKDSVLPDELHPCKHLTSLVSRRSDDTLRGPAKWYIDVHVLTCPRCRTALEGLRALQSQIAELSSQSAKTGLHLEPEEWRQVENGWSSP